MTKTIVIDGNNIGDIASFYDEINRVFMADEDWRLGHSLDGFNDMLYGGYGALEGDDDVTLVWQNMEKARASLGFDATREFYRNKLRHPETFNVDHASKSLAELESGNGASFFEIVLEIIADHPNIELVAR